MKLLSTTILRRASSDPVPPQESSSSSSSSNGNNTMTVDLANKDALPALRVLKQTPSLHRNVTNAVVNTESCVWYGHIKMDIHALVEVFQCLSELPRLHNVTIDLSHLQVPVAALTALLRGARVLRELHLVNLHLVGPVEALEVALRAHTQLARVRFLRCKGHAIQSFMTHLSCMKKLELRHTAVGVVANNDENPWMLLGRSTTLQSLTVQEIPDLKTDHIMTFIHALAFQQEEGTSNLQELHITSVNAVDVDGQLCGPAMADLLIVHPTCTIKTLTLKFGSSWKTVGTSVSTLLRRNPTITSLCVEVAGRDHMCHAMEIIRAMQSNFVMKRLKLCLDQDQQLDGPLDKRLVQAMEGLLVQDNHILQSLVVLDENREKYPLTPAIRHKLELNSSRLPKLLYNAKASSREYLEAMIDSKDSLDAVYYALTNQPDLLLDLSPNAMAILEADSAAADSDDESADPTADWGKIGNSHSSTKSSSRRQSAKKRLLRFFK